MYTLVAVLIKSVKCSGELSLWNCFQHCGASALDDQNILKKRASHLQLEFRKQKKVGQNQMLWVGRADKTVI